MIMEDDYRIATALALRLKSAGYEPLIVPDGYRGLTHSLHDRPDLLLMDIWMPVGTGFSVVQRLQPLGLAGIPFIFITASKAKGLRETALDLGASGFFEKPYDPEQLLSAIGQALDPDPAGQGPEAAASGHFDAPPRL
jgi:DNA-binding response OmpR family regulator